MSNELYHHGVKGQKWGVRRYQNEDGSLTKEGKERLQARIDRHDIRDEKARKVGRISLMSMPISIGLTAAGAILGGPLGSATILAGSATFLAEKWTAIASVGARFVNNKITNNAENALLDDKLRHGEEWDDHKYIDKVKTKNGYRYIYEKPKSVDRKAKLTGMTKTEQTTKVANSTNALQAVAGLFKNTKGVVKDAAGNLIDYALGDKASKVKDLPRYQYSHKTYYDARHVQNELYRINPNYNSKNEDYCENCSYCTATYDLIRRDPGLDLMADNHEDFTATTISEQLQWYEDAEFVDLADMYDTMFDSDEDFYEYLDERFGSAAIMNADLYKALLDDTIMAQGSNARGFIDMFWNTGGGHAIAYEILSDDDGTKSVHYLDTQLGKDVTDVFVNDYLVYTSGEIGLIRTDNVEPTDKITKTCKKYQSS